MVKVGSKPASFLRAPFGASRPERCAPTILEVCGLGHAASMSSPLTVVNPP